MRYQDWRKARQERARARREAERALRALLEAEASLEAELETLRLFRFALSLSRGKRKPRKIRLGREEARLSLSSLSSLSTFSLFLRELRREVERLESSSPQAERLSGSALRENVNRIVHYEVSGLWQEEASES